MLKGYTDLIQILVTEPEDRSERIQDQNNIMDDDIVQDDFRSILSIYRQTTGYNTKC